MLVLHYIRTWRHTWFSLSLNSSCICILLYTTSISSLASLFRDAKGAASACLLLLHSRERNTFSTLSLSLTWLKNQCLLAGLSRFYFLFLLFFCFPRKFPYTRKFSNSRFLPFFCRFDTTILLLYLDDPIRITCYSIWNHHALVKGGLSLYLSLTLSVCFLSLIFSSSIFSSAN